MTIKVKKRNFLKKKKIKQIKNELGEYGVLLENKKNPLIKVELEKDTLLSRIFDMTFGEVLYKFIIAVLISSSKLEA